MEYEYAPFMVAAAVLALLAAVTFVGKQWHVTVFLLLNVVLLAILFTSRDRPAATSGDEVKKAEKKRRVGRRPARDGAVEAGSDPDDKSGGEREGFGREMSDEELNERVERFIASFRQHLVLDGRGR